MALKIPLLTQQELRTRWTSNTAVGLTQIAIQWLVIFGSGALAIQSQSWWAVGLAVLTIATRQHALAVLMHDAAHRTLLPNIRMNEFVSEIFLAFPMMISTQLYRRHHLAHHRYLGTPNDPDDNDNQGPRSNREFAVTWFLDLSGLNLIRSLTTAQNFSVVGVLFKNRAKGGLSWQRRVSFVIVAVLGGSAAIATIGWQWLLILWFLPLFTATQALVRFNAYAEHGGCLHSHELNASRTTLASAPSRFLFAPCSINYHLEHHLYPAVPHFRLPKLHRTLMNDPTYRREAHITRGYFFGRDCFRAEICQKSQFTTVGR